MKTIDVARWVSLIAAFIWGAVAEYKLAVAVGADQYTAALLPLVLDVWGFAAFKTGRTWHVTGALAAMFGTQMVSHLLTLGEAPYHLVMLSIAVSAIPPAVSLACHRLGEATEIPAEDVKPAVAPLPRNGFVPISVTDEVHHWTRVDTPVETRDVAPVETLDVTLDNSGATFTPVETVAPDSAATFAAAAVSTETVDTDDVQDDNPDDTVSTAERRMTKAEIAAKATALYAELGTWKAVEQEMGISRQWIGECRKAAGVTV